MSDKGHSCDRMLRVVKYFHLWVELHTCDMCEWTQILRLWQSSENIPDVQQTLLALTIYALLFSFGLQYLCYCINTVNVSELII